MAKTLEVGCCGNNLIFRAVDVESDVRFNVEEASCGACGNHYQRRVGRSFIYVLAREDLEGKDQYKCKECDSIILKVVRGNEGVPYCPICEGRPK